MRLNCVGYEVVFKKHRPGRACLCRLPAPCSASPASATLRQQDQALPAPTSAPPGGEEEGEGL